jgi:transcriptional regulator with XRE-family HTH domain
MGNAIRTFREGNSLTVEEVAEQAGIPLDEYLQIENGEMEATWGDLRRIAKGAKVPLPQLLALQEEIADREHREGDLK